MTPIFGEFYNGLGILTLIFFIIASMFSWFFLNPLKIIWKTMIANIHTFCKLSPCIAHSRCVYKIHFAFHRGTINIKWVGFLCCWIHARQIFTWCFDFKILRIAFYINTFAIARWNIKTTWNKNIQIFNTTFNWFNSLFFLFSFKNVSKNKRFLKIFAELQERSKLLLFLSKRLHLTKTLFITTKNLDKVWSS